MMQMPFCMMLAEGALDVLHAKSHGLDKALRALGPDDYHELVVELAERFQGDYLYALKPDPDDPEPTKKVTSLR